MDADKEQIAEVLIRSLSAAICASDVHYMDHPNSAPRFVWDSGRDTIMGHEFIGEVVGHGPDCSGDFPIRSRVTSLPLLIRDGAEPHVIGHDPDAPGAFGEPVDWYGTLDAVVDGRFDPLPSIGKAIGLDEVPDAIDQARKSQGPPRVVVHPTGEA